MRNKFRFNNQGTRLHNESLKSRGIPFHSTSYLLNRPSTSVADYDPEKCCICGKTALYKWSDVKDDIPLGYCKEHRIIVKPHR
jgi:hypothetical protein